MAGGMEDLMLIPPLPELETEEGKILREMLQILNYICVARTLSRQELARKLLRVAAKCMDTLNNLNLKLTTLEKRQTDENRRWQNTEDGAQHEEYDCEDAESWGCFSTEKSQVEQPPRNPRNSPNEDTILSSTSEYKVQGLLGSGVFGTVVQCLKRPSNETVAVKIIKDSSAIEKAKEEVEMLNSLKALGAEKFNILICNDSFIFDGHFCLEFNKLDVNLFDFIQVQGFLQLREIRPVIQQLAVALCFLKEAGVVHTDIKTHNVMLVDCLKQPMKVQVIDFGEAICDPEEWAGGTFHALWYRSPEVLLGAPLTRSIDVWSLGCIAGEMLLGTPLFSVFDEIELMRRIVSVVGQPPNDVLELGLNTDYFFNETGSNQWPHRWTLKSAGEISPQTSATERPKEINTKLHSLLRPPLTTPTEDDEAVEFDWVFFVILVEMMLHTNALERITPEQILAHPFVTLSHLQKQSFNFYVKSSIEYMKPCNNWSYEEGGNAQRLISNTSNPEFVTIEHPLNMEEPSAQEIFERGEISSTNDRRLEQSESLEENVEKTQSTTPADETIPPNTRTANPELETSSTQHNDWGLDGGENFQQSSSNGSSSDGNQLTAKHPPCEPRGEEPPSVQEAFIGGDKSSTRGGHRLDLDSSTSVSRSPHEDETQSATSDRAPPPLMEKTPLKSDTSPGLIDRARPLEDGVKVEEIKVELERRNNVEPHTRKKILEATGRVGKCRQASD